jgi:uncharacterized protein YdeI (YjbR/CyaY-like superfamily)
MEVHNGVEAFYPKSRKAWRHWLQRNHVKKEKVWLIFYKKETEKSGFTYAEAVEEALCFGWIDSTANKRDAESSYRYFAKRSPKSNWSKLNKQRVKKLIKEGLMTKAGLDMITLAKKSGTWIALDHVEDRLMPDDLLKALAKNKHARKNFEAFSKSSQKIILGWIANARRDETRKKRIQETVTLASKNIKANHYRQ